MNRRNDYDNPKSSYPLTSTPAPREAPDGIFTHLRVSLIATVVLAIVCCGVYPLVVWALSQAIFHHKANGSLITDSSGNVIGSELIGQSFSDAKYFHPRPSAAGSGYDPTASGGSNLGPTSKKLLNGTTKPTTQPNPKGGDPIPGPDAVDYDGIKLRIVNYCEENSIPYQLVIEHKNSDGSITGIDPVDPKTFKTAKGDYDQVKLVNAFNDDTNTLTIKPGKPISADAVTASASGLDPHISPENAEFQIGRVLDARKPMLTEQQLRQLVSENTDGRSLGILGEPGVHVLKLNLALDKVAPVAPPPATQPTTQPAPPSAVSNDLERLPRS
jgi:K+-transporting ATPase ATPase C chain